MYKKSDNPYLQQQPSELHTQERGQKQYTIVQNRPNRFYYRITQNSQQATHQLPISQNVKRSFFQMETHKNIVLILFQLQFYCYLKKFLVIASQRLQENIINLSKFLRKNVLFKQLGTYSLLLTVIYSSRFKFILQAQKKYIAFSTELNDKQLYSPYKKEDNLIKLGIQEWFLQEIKEQRSKNQFYLQVERAQSYLNPYTCRLTEALSILLAVKQCGKPYKYTKRLKTALNISW